MKTTGISCVTKFRLLFFLGHPIPQQQLQPLPQQQLLPLRQPLRQPLRLPLRLPLRQQQLQPPQLPNVAGSSAVDLDLAVLNKLALNVKYVLAYNFLDQIYLVVLGQTEISFWLISFSEPKAVTRAS